MPEKALAHPLRWWQFYGACVRHATTGAWGVTGNISTLLAFLPPLTKAIWPSAYMQAATSIRSFGYGDDLFWKVPLWFGVAIWVSRLIAAPFRIYRDKPAAVAGAPDVRLEGAFPGTFALHAYGHACEIRTGPIVIEAAVVATERHGEQIMPVWHPRCTIEFRVVSDLRDGHSVTVEPTLFYDEGYDPPIPWPDTAPAAVMLEFFHTAKLARRGVWPDKLSESELDAILERSKQPFHISFDITFWNVEHTQQWKRSEVLVYEPQPDRAFVRHGGVPVLSVGARP